MSLTWTQSSDIAAALKAAYPDQERYRLERCDVLGLILTLPAFNDTSVPPDPKILDHVLWTWMRLDDGIPTTASGGGS